MSEAAFNAAVAELQSELPAIGKDQTANAGQYSYSYADLTTIAAKALPLLSKHGLSFTAFPTMGEHGFVLKYSLRHLEGHCEDGFYPLPDAARSSPQEIGSAITYARRYSLCAATGIAPGGEDDDGQKAAETRAQPRQAPAESNGNGVQSLKTRIWTTAKAKGWSQSDLEIDFASSHEGLAIGSADETQLAAYAEKLVTA